jgi:hypothetical protein
MDIRVDEATRDWLAEWKVPAPLAARKCVNRYNRKPWRIKPRKRKKTAILQDIPEDLGHEPWKVEAIIEDCVDQDLKNYVKPTPIKLEAE